MRTILRYVSDLHLELKPNLNSLNSLKGIWSFSRCPNTQYLLALADDIGNWNKKEILLNFLGKVSQSYCKVFYILGNHEYQG